MATNAELLVQAQAAYHALMTGTAVRVVVDQNQERVEYGMANADRLNAYILSLQALIAGQTSRGPFRVYF